MASKGLKVDIKGDASHFERTMGKVKASMNTLGPAMLNIAKSTAAVGAAATAAAAAFSAWKIKEVLDLGGKMSDLSARTGVAAGEIKVLEEAMRLAGVEGADVAKTLQTMGKNLQLAFEDDASDVADVLKQLGLNAAELRNMNLDRAFDAIGRRIAGMSTESERARASMALFSRSGLPLVALFKDFDRTMGTARGNVGGLAGILTQFADRFDAVSDAIGGLNLKFQQFYAGFASGIIGDLERAQEAVTNFDLTKLGQRIGSAISDAISGKSEAIIKIGEVIGELLSTGIKIAWEDSATRLIRLWAEKTEALNRNIPLPGQQVLAIGAGAVSSATRDMRSSEIIQGNLENSRVPQLLQEIKAILAKDTREPLVQY